MNEFVIYECVFCWNLFCCDHRLCFAHFVSCCLVWAVSSVQRVRLDHWMHTYYICILPLYIIQSKHPKLGQTLQFDKTTEHVAKKNKKEKTAQQKNMLQLWLQTWSLYKIIPSYAMGEMRECWNGKCEHFANSIIIMWEKSTNALCILQS